MDTFRYAALLLGTYISVICHIMCIGPFRDQPSVPSWLLSPSWLLLHSVFNKDKGFQECFLYNLHKELIAFWEYFHSFLLSSLQYFKS